MFSTTTIEFSALTTGDKIGEGGFGIVYKGTYHFKPAAIKQLQINNFSPEAEEEFTKEANMMARLHHPNIVHFYGYCSVPKCLVMEYMPKGSLFNVLHDKKQPLDWNIRIRIAIDIASGLAFLHSRDILHRDIKSLNVLLDAQMDAKLTDFGLSKVKNETKSKTTATRTHQDTVGTVQWMAPELFKRRAVFTQKADIYSLGITFWELASRKIPYAEDTQAAIPTFVQQGDREDIPSDCPEKLAYLIQQCWANDPNTRPSASDIARFMTTDAKTLEEDAPKKTDLISGEYQFYSDSYQVASAGYVLPAQASPNVALQASPKPMLTSFQNLQLSPLAASPTLPPPPNASFQRRGTKIFNLSDKKEEHEKTRYVLEQLRAFFLEDREEGERTANYDIYNEHLKKVSKDSIHLVYKPKQNKHILYVNDEPVDNEIAAKEVSKMLRSLPTESVVQKPVVSSTPQQNIPNTPAMLTQLNQALKSSPTKDEVKVNAEDLKLFLRLVAEGEQDQAEAMLKNNPTLALVPGDVIDLSKRSFTNITAFQYAVWALDWHMWTMIRKYLPDNEAKQQAEEFEMGVWVKNHGIDARLILENLVKAYDTTIALYKALRWSDGDMAWVEDVGGVQLLLPAHVVNEYCHSRRSFFMKLADLKDAVLLPLPRTRTVNETGEWFTAVCNGGKLGKKFAIGIECGLMHLGVAKCISKAPGFRILGDDRCRLELRRESERELVSVLLSTRTAQRDELINELKARTVQRKAA